MRLKVYARVVVAGAAALGLVRCTQYVVALGSHDTAPRTVAKGGFVDIVVDPARSSCETHAGQQAVSFLVALDNRGTADDSVSVLLWRSFSDGTIADRAADPLYDLPAPASTTSLYDLRVPWEEAQGPPTRCAVLFEGQPGATSIPVNVR